MSGLEVIGGISAVISILDASKRIYDNVQKDINLPKTFEVVGRRLPVIKHTLEICISNLQPNTDLIPEAVCDDLGDLIYVCQTQAKHLEEIFQKVLPGPNDTLNKRYSTALRRMGKGKEVEELMKLITKSVQDVVNHQSVMSVDQSQNISQDLKQVIQEMESLQSSTQTVSNSEGSQTTYNLSGGGSHRIYTHTGSGDLIEHQHNGM